MSLVSLKIIISEIQSCQKIEQGPVSLLKLINHRIHLNFGNATMFSQGNLKLKPKIETCGKKKYRSQFFLKKNLSHRKCEESY